MSTGVGMNECCLSGKLASGTPTGRIEEINGLQTYVAMPADASKAASVVFLVDIFGWELPNIRLLADNYARAGFYVYVPDVHEGDSLPAAFLDDVEPDLATRAQLGTVAKGVKTAKVAATLGPWLVTHREAVVKPLVDGFVNTVKLTPGTDRVGVVGFCWGGRYAVLAAHGAVDAAVAFHPSLVAVPGDFEPVSRPLALAMGDEDSLLPKEQAKQIAELMDKKSDVPSEVRFYEDQVHGFALRGDWSSDKDKKAMDDAEQQGIGWLKRFLV